MAITLASQAQLSVSDPRILVQLDIGQVNIEWINAGAGIWEVNAANIYARVDSTLLDGFSAQEFGAVGSVSEDGKLLTQVDVLSDLPAIDKQFFYNKDTRSLYVVLENYNEPFLNQAISIGIVNGYSFDAFSPNETQQQPYEARLVSVPSISISRDPLFFGKLVYGGGTVTLENSDGEFDSYGEDKDVYGNPVRIYYGFPDLDLSDYLQLYTGYVGRIVAGETTFPIEVKDKRKQLTRAITYSSAGAKNALDTIKDILTTYFPLVYNTTYFNTTAWDAATALVDEVDIDMQEPVAAINVIEQICTSVFGLFIVDKDGKFSFKIVDTTASVVTTIKAIDVLSDNEIEYEPTEVISSVRVGYNKDWLTTGTAYLYYTDDTREASVFTAYKTYKEQVVDTLLPTLSAATAFGTVFMDYFDRVHGSLPMEIPMAYYDIALGDMVDAEIERATTTMLGTTKAEVININYGLGKPAMTVKLRIV